MAVDIKHGKPPNKKDAWELIRLIPGASTVIDIGKDVKKIGSAIGQDLGFIKDDGKPKSCWLKSHGRGFGRPLGFSESCSKGRDQVGMWCYEPCSTGKPYGPVCWGSCPAGTKPCGVACLLEGEKCVGLAAKITKDVVKTGFATLSSDYFSAVKGAVSVVADVSIPICVSMNGMENDMDWDDDIIWPDEEGYYT